MRVQVVYALPEKQWASDLELPAGATVADAVRSSGIPEQAGLPADGEYAVGVWGRVVGRDEPLSEGDRVEIYRALQCDPREARRRLVESRAPGPARRR